MPSGRVYRERKSVGLCPNCGGTPAPGKSNCEPCRVHRLTQLKRCQTRWRRDRAAKQLCVQCGGPRDSRKKTCEDCLKTGRGKGANYRNLIVERGLCPTCRKNPCPPERKICFDCIERNKGKANERVAKGLCAKCGKCQFSVQRQWPVCLECWLKEQAKNATNDSKNWQMLKDIFDAQNGRCVYTDEVLIPGENASLDHRIPGSRQGSDDRDNLQWVTKRINTMKNDCTHEEFIAMCKLVTARFPE
jgi:hypothetical protein